MTTKVIFVPKDKPARRADWQERVRAQGVQISESTDPATHGLIFTHGVDQITIPKAPNGPVMLKPAAYVGRKKLLGILVDSGALISVDMAAIRGAYEEMSKEGRFHAGR